MRIRHLAPLAALAALALGACGDTRGVLGLERKAPDEYQVLRHAPLSMPPNFSLRPPAKGAERPQEDRVENRARQVLLGDDGNVDQASPASPAPRSAGEAALLGAAGAGEADPEIRDALDRDNAVLGRGDDGLADSLMFRREEGKPGTAIDAEREARRLRKGNTDGGNGNDGRGAAIERVSGGR